MGLFLIYKKEIVVHIWSHAGLHSAVTVLKNGLPKNKVKTYRQTEMHIKHTQIDIKKM